MSSFVDNDLTNAGIALLAEVQLGASFEPTKIVMGSGFLPDGTTSRTVTDVIKPEATLAISKWEKSADGNIVIGGVYSNQDITEPFYYRELGLYAKATKPNGDEVPECLYSYGNAGNTADLMGAYSSGMAVERVIDVVTYIGNDADVSLTIESGVYIPMTQKGAAGGVATLDNSGKVPTEQLPAIDPTFDELMNTYSYTWTMESEDTTTITVTLGEDCPVSASMTAVISEGDSGETVVDVTTVIDGVTTKSQHTINDNGGKGGPING